MRRKGDLSKIKNQRNNENLRNADKSRKATTSFYSEVYRYKLKQLPKLSEDEFLDFKAKLKKEKQVKQLNQLILFFAIMLVVGGCLILVANFTTE